MRSSIDIASRSLLGVTCVAVACGAFAIACSDAQPPPYRPGFGARGNAAVADDASAGGAMDASTSGDAGAMDAGASDAPVAHEAGDASDAGHAGDADAAIANAFTGAPAYVATTGTSTLNAAHNFGGANPTNPAGQACLNCHVTGGAGVAFLMGGTVWKDVGATIPAPQVEVALRDGAGVTRTAYTDANGNFFLLASGAGTLATPALGGVRDATSTRLMVGAVNAANCNDCHKAGGQTPINVP